MGEMHETYGEWDNGEYNPMDEDEDEDEPSALCLNCDSGFTSKSPRLFCTDLCRDEAHFIRYARRCKSDGSEQLPDVQDALEIQMAHLLSGGYASRERVVPKAMRNQVIARDRGKCQMCGRSANEIDHILDGTNDLSNLQLLCHECHMKKTQARLVPLSDFQGDRQAVLEKARELKARIHARIPLRISDDPDRWPNEWEKILADRRLVWSRFKE